MVLPLLHNFFVSSTSLWSIETRFCAIISAATVLETLPAEEIPEFLDDFSETHILHTYYAYNSPKDVCLRLNYENGNFLIIWANYAEESYAGYIGEYSPDGEPLTFWGSFSALSFYKNLVDRYFDYSLEEN